MHRKRAHSDLLKAIPKGGGGEGKEMTREEKRKLVEPFTYVRRRVLTQYLSWFGLKRCDWIQVNYSPDFVKDPKVSSPIRTFPSMT